MILNNIETERGTFTDIVDNQGNIIETAEEFYQRWLNKIDICPEEIKTNQQLTEENKLLKEQVKALTDANDFQEELIVEMAALVYA